MKVVIFSSKPYDEHFLKQFNAESGHELSFLQERLTVDTAYLAHGSQAICAFVNDSLDAATLEKLVQGGTQFIVLRCAGFNNLDQVAAKKLGLLVARVPSYSPYAVAEHAIALLLCLNRHIHKAHNRVREGNFSIDGLMGHDIHGKTIGVIGTGVIGSIFAKILIGFGGDVLAHDMVQHPECLKNGVKYVGLDELFERSYIISLHCPLTPETHHMIDEGNLAKMRDGVFIINTSRGALIDTEAVSEAVKSGKIGGLALDVYEEESELFFEDRSDCIIQDDVLMRLMAFPNVLVTSHQAFFTHEAMENIAKTTLSNLTDFESGRSCSNRINLANS